MQQRRHIYISGLVQGVYFRYNTQLQAQSLGLKGWVRNLPDGRVEAVVEGDAPAVEAMLAWCRTGTPPARVNRIEVLEEKPLGSFRNFSIR